uniref:Calnexin n=1 Tax=Oncorhynchus mykiss TaxID=8022 RepID=A0A8C7US17_ONCMY
MELKVRYVLLLAVGLWSTLLLTTVTAHQEEEDEPIMEMGGDMDVEDEMEELDHGEELLDGEVEADMPPGPPPVPKVTYKAPEPTGEHFFAESFDMGTLDRPFIFDTKPLIVQYEVNFQQGIDCGGAYVKLLSQTPDLNLDEFVDKTPYTIMFGPDKCGEDYKLHFIFRHKNPKTGEYEEKHAKKPDSDLRTYYTDKKTHLYTLVVNPDNSFEVLVDQAVVNSGNLLTDMTPPINPAAEIEDPDDHKPEDWDERPKIQDPDAVKPEDWDEDAPKQIPDEDAVKPDGWLDDESEYTSDPDAVKPEDWDEDMDGEWEAPQVPNALCETAPGCGAWQRPMIDNPSYKGKWKAPMIDNPNYQGVWKPRKIANPAFFEDLHPFRMTPFNAVGLELWSMSSDIFFDNFFITNERHTADRWANDGWGLKKAAEGAAEPGLVNQMMTAADERPWLWVVYVLTVAVPLVLIIVFCCTGKKTAAAAADYKKTDEPQPDVKEEEVVEKAEADQVKEEKSQPGKNSPSPFRSLQKQEDDLLRRSPRNRKLRKD